MMKYREHKKIVIFLAINVVYIYMILFYFHIFFIRSIRFKNVANALFYWNLEGENMN